MKSIIIYDWMLKDKALSGIKLLMFATIYHFTSLGSGCFMSVKSWLELLHCSRSQFFKAKQDLIDSGLLTVHIKTNALFCTPILSLNEVQFSDDTHIGSSSDTLDAQLSWDELIAILTKSDNETAESENETVESDNETIPF